MTVLFWVTKIRTPLGTVYHWRKKAQHRYWLESNSEWPLEASDLMTRRWVIVMRIGHEEHDGFFWNEDLKAVKWHYPAISVFTRQGRTAPFLRAQHCWVLESQIALDFRFASLIDAVRSVFRTSDHCLTYEWSFLFPDTSVHKVTSDISGKIDNIKKTSMTIIRNITLCFHFLALRLFICTACM